MHQRPSRTAFSLTELLVVIAVIVVVAGLVTAAARTMRDSARSVNCLANLRQFGMGEMAYAQDNRGLLVPSKSDYRVYPPATPGGGTLVNSLSWMEQLFNYMPQTDNRKDSKVIYVCPQAKYNGYQAQQWPSTYGANLAVHGMNYDFRGGNPAPGYGDRQIWPKIMVSSVKRPSEIISIMDSSENDSGTCTEQLTHTNASEIVSDAWRADKQADGKNGVNAWFVNNNRDMNDGQIDGNGTYNSNGAAYFPRWRHQKNRGGMLFFDGHAASLDRTQTLIRNFSNSY